MSYMKDVSIDEVNEIEARKSTIRDLLDNGCMPIKQCRDCPVNDLKTPGGVLLCAALTSIREHITI